MRKSQIAVFIEAIGERDFSACFIFEDKRGVSFEHRLSADPLYNAFLFFAHQPFYLKSELFPELFEGDGDNARLGLGF